MSEIPIPSFEQDPKHNEGKDFSFTTIENFDAHISSQIRGYMELDAIVKGVADFALEDGTNVYDIGCSTGRFIRTLADNLDAETDPARKKNVQFFGIEPNSNIRKDFETRDNVHLITDGVRTDTSFNNASLITSIFTIQFMPAHSRLPVLQNIYNGLNPNGIFVLAEKVFSDDAQIERMLNTIHLNFKRDTMLPDDIMDKENRLTAVMRPYPLTKNLKMLREVGFTQIDTFWRVNNFVGIIAIK